MSTAVLRHFSGMKPYNLAGCAYFFISEPIDVRDYDPLMPFTGNKINLIQVSGMGSRNSSGKAMLVVEDWINHAHKVGATTKNALLCLAANFDEKPTIPMLALHIGMVVSNGKDHGEATLSIDDYMDLVEMLYFGNMGGAYDLLCEETGVMKRPGVSYKAPPKSRRQWAQKLGHDVLLHPVDLQPCRDADGPLDLSSMRCSGYDGEFTFKKKDGQTFNTPDFPPIP